VIADQCSGTNVAINRRRSATESAVAGMLTSAVADASKHHLIIKMRNYFA